MAVKLSPQHRDALFNRVLLDIEAFEDLLAAIGQEDLEQSYKLGRRISDGFRLIVDGRLGWKTRTAEPTTITLPVVDLRRIVRGMRDDAVAEWEGRRPDREETEREWAEITHTRDACDSILEQL
jgi:hypothetical protein